MLANIIWKELIPSNLAEKRKVAQVGAGGEAALIPGRRRKAAVWPLAFIRRDRER